LAVSVWMTRSPSCTCEVVNARRAAWFATVVTSLLAEAYTDSQVAGAMGGSTPLDGSVTDIKVASGAAIAQSKIAGLVAALAGRWRG
jgi:hypothetical protein